jgi:ankyrin repeat protein
MSHQVKGSKAGWVISSLFLSLASLAAASNDLQLVDAVERGDREGVRSLLEQNADVNTAQADGTTALHWAAHRDDLETAELLMGAGADVNAANHYGVTPLSLACTNGSAAALPGLHQRQRGHGPEAVEGGSQSERCPTDRRDRHHDGSPFRQR